MASIFDRIDAEYKASHQPTDSPDQIPQENESLTTQKYPQADYGQRVDGSKKGKGFFGELPMRDESGRIATEMAVGVNINDQEKLIPTLVPTLSEEEKDHLLKGGEPTPEIMSKSIAHAEQRSAEGKSPFADEDQNQKRHSIFDKLEQERYPGEEIEDEEEVPEEESVPLTLKGAAEKGEKIVGEGVRHLSRSTARILEYPIDVVKGINDLSKAGVKYLVEKVVGKEEADKYDEKIDALHGSVFGLGAQLPSTEEMKNVEKKFSGEFLQPQSEGEKIADEAIQDIEGWVMMGGKEKTLLQHIGKAIKVVGFGEGAKQISKATGAKESTQNLVKTGAEIIESMRNPGGFKKVINSYYKAAEFFGKDVAADATKLEVALTDFITATEKGTIGTSEKLAYEEAKLIRDKISNGELKLDELMASKRSMNDKSSKFYTENPSFINKKARQKVNEVRETLLDFAKENSSAHPDWYKNYNAAERATQTVYESKKISNWIKNLIPKTKIGQAIKYGLGTGAAVMSPVYSLFGIAGYGALRSTENLSMLRDPTIRKYYLRTLYEATRQNTPNTIKAINNLNDAIKESEDED